VTTKKFGELLETVVEPPLVCAVVPYACPIGR